ncbi:hypothetical protein NQ853_19360, partial [Acinetobacter baumannii]|nr:hypothetical protein [Acinetobacter baumannii]
MSIVRQTSKYGVTLTIAYIVRGVLNCHRLNIEKAYLESCSSPCPHGNVSAIRCIYTTIIASTIPYCAGLCL